MLISKETDYALRILRILADKQMHRAQDISLSELIPRQFIYRVIKKLETGGFIRVRRGARGGCILAAPLQELSLWDVLKAVDNGLVVNACTDQDYTCDWEKENGVCRYHQKLLQVQESMEKELQTIPLHSLLT